MTQNSPPTPVLTQAPALAGPSRALFPPPAAADAALQPDNPLTQPQQPQIIQPVQLAQPLLQPVVTQPIHVKKTHVSDAISNILKSLPLPARLKRNKEIEEQNEARLLLTLRHAQDPVAFPDPGSESASFITIDSSEISFLSSPTILDSLRNVMPFHLIKRLADIKLTNITNSLKRPESLTDLMESSTSHAAKRRCMSALTLISRDTERPTSFNFPQIMFETENRMPIPLPFFTHKSLRFIINNLAILPTKKVESDGSSKKAVILDIDKLLKTLGEELTLSFGQYGEAAAQMFKFQEQRDGDLPDSGETWTQFWRSHFTFFENREDAEEYYDEWKHVELELRRDRWSYGYKYDASHYSQRYMTAKNNMIQRTKNREDLDQLIAKALESRSRTRDFPPRTNFPSGSNPRTTQRSFQEAGSRSSAPAFCILCADQSHTLFHHPRDKSKFRDGKIIWAKFNNGRLTSPDGQEICVKYNIGGSRYCAKDVKHGDNRVHLCSFCGDKTHHALSWTCRSKDS